MGCIVKSFNNIVVKLVIKMFYVMFKRSCNYFLWEKINNIGGFCGVLLFLELGFIEKLYCLKRLLI